jgi:hypothetical protein
MNKIDIDISTLTNVTQSAPIPFGDLHDTLDDGFLLRRIELILDGVVTDLSARVIAFGLYPFQLTTSEALPSLSNGAFIFLETVVGNGNYTNNVITDDLFTPLLLVNGAVYYAVAGDTAVKGILRLYGDYNRPSSVNLTMSSFDVPIFPEITP